MSSGIESAGIAERAPRAASNSGRKGKSSVFPDTACAGLVLSAKR